MVKFKLFNKKEKKFTSIYFGPKKLYKIRYQLGIWNNTANDDSLKKIYDLVKQDNRFQLHFKFNSRWVIADSANVKEYIDSLSKNKTMKKGGKKIIKKNNSKKKTKKCDDFARCFGCKPYGKQCRLCRKNKKIIINPNCK